jgi:hypothetical protein
MRSSKTTVPPSCLKKAQGSDENDSTKKKSEKKNTAKQAGRLQLSKRFI